MGMTRRAPWLLGVALALAWTGVAPSAQSAAWLGRPDHIASFPVITEGEPLDAEAYFHNIMNDHRLSASRRDAAAKLLITGKAKVPVKGKKDERADKASNVASGNRFAPAAPPSKIAGRIGQ